MFAILLLGVVPACAQQPTAAEKVEADARIAAELTEVENQIKEAETQDAKYTGGLIKALIAARLETLRQTKAMLQQRAKAQNLNVALRYTIDGKAFAPPPTASQEIAGIESELTATRLKIAVEEADAARYSGGLVLAMKLSSIATMHQTEAMLDQKRLSLKYGLPQYLGFQTSAPASQAVTAPRPSVKESLFDIVSVDAKVTESNSTWWKYAWKVTIRNRDASSHAYRVMVEFHDKDGFIVDTDDADGAVQANAEDTITGFALVTAGVAGNIAGTKAKVQQTR
jgi:hypothetical protein